MDIDRTAIGIEALTVRPIFNPRYTVAIPKMIPKMIPSMTDLNVNSAIFSCGATNGLCSSIIPLPLMLSDISTLLTI
ncbi:MAG: hypothetical protein BWY32_03238 [bacterium ADurb.Bin243]|nr:MAG: hypothetical protein BWY32_03238 [bacterium ADurb.Bin243]